MNGRSCGQYLMFGVLISRTCENDGSHRCRSSQRISSSWALMLVVAKEQFLMFHQAEGRCLLNAHQELGSNLIWSLRFPFCSDLFICLWWLCWLLRRSDSILVVRLKQKNPSSSIGSVQSSSLWWQNLNLFRTRTRPVFWCFFFFLW